MPEKPGTTVELLKYPLVVFSIVISLVAMRYLLGLEFGVVTEVSTQGVKFTAVHGQAADAALSELESQLNEAIVKINALEARAQTPERELRIVRADAFSAAQMVSDTTAKIAKIREDFAKEQKAATILRGYIWIGDYDGTWHKPQLAKLDTGQPIEMAPAKIQIGTEYKVLGNMTVRDGLPNNNRGTIEVAPTLA